MSYCRAVLRFGWCLVLAAGCAQQPVLPPGADSVGGAEPAVSGPSDSPAATGTTAPAPAPAVDAALQAQFALGVEHLRQGRLADARVEFERIHNAHPELGGPVLNLGIIALREGDRQSAAAWFDKALASNPRNTEALNFLGVMAREDGRFAEAESYYRRALEADPGFAAAHLNLGMLLELYLGRFEEALQHYETYQSLQAEPDPKVKNWIADLQNRLKGGS